MGVLDVMHSRRKVILCVAQSNDFQLGSDYYQSYYGDGIGDDIDIIEYGANVVEYGDIVKKSNVEIGFD